jgi:hypothetical protein
MLKTVYLQPIVTDVIVEGESLSIYSYYDGLGKIICAFINTFARNIGNIFFKENELVIINHGYDKTDFYINQRGELVVYSDIANGFEIDELGQLMLTE